MFTSFALVSTGFYVVINLNAGEIDCVIIVRRNFVEVHRAAA